MAICGNSAIRCQSLGKYSILTTDKRSQEIIENKYIPQRWMFSRDDDSYWKT